MTKIENLSPPEKGPLLERISDRLTVFVLTKAFELISGDKRPEVAHSQKAQSVGRIALLH